METRTYLRYWKSVHILFWLWNLFISNFAFCLSRGTKRVCSGQNHWLLLVTLPDTAPIISTSILVWLLRAQWSLVNWQSHLQSLQERSMDSLGGPVNRPLSSQQTWRLPSLTEPQIARQLTSHRPFATFSAGCFFIKLWIIEQIVNSKDSWKQRKSVNKH